MKDRGGVGRIGPLLLLALLAGVPYLNTLGNGFVLDDTAIIVRNPLSDDEFQWFVQVDLWEADPTSLNIGGYYTRHPNPYNIDGAMLGEQKVFTWRDLGPIVAEIMRDAIVVGAVPWFDTDGIAQPLQQRGLIPTWHYHLVDVETLAAGRLGLLPPWNFDSILAAYDLKYRKEDRHTALGDARMCRDLYDKVMLDAG